MQDLLRKGYQEWYLQKIAQSLLNLLLKSQLKALLNLFHFFGVGDDIKRNFRSMIGGLGCKNALDGEGDCEEKTKGAYIDIVLRLR